RRPPPRFLSGGRLRALRHRLHGLRVSLNEPPETLEEVTLLVEERRDGGRIRGICGSRGGRGRRGVPDDLCCLLTSSRDDRVRFALRVGDGGIDGSRRDGNAVSETLVLLQDRSPILRKPVEELVDLPL